MYVTWVNSSTVWSFFGSAGMANAGESWRDLASRDAVAHVGLADGYARASSECCCAVRACFCRSRPARTPSAAQTLPRVSHMPGRHRAHVRATLTGHFVAGGSTALVRGSRVPVKDPQT